jgi:hypothetical protein
LRYGASSFAMSSSEQVRWPMKRRRSAPRPLARMHRCGNIASMNSAEALQQLRELAPAVRALGVASLYLFGSAARNEARSAENRREPSIGNPHLLFDETSGIPL